MTRTNKTKTTPYNTNILNLFPSIKRGLLPLILTALFLCVSGHTIAAVPQSRVITKSVLLRNISQRESGHDWTAENHNLYIGKWQMGRDAFETAGYSSKQVRYIFAHFHRNHSVMPQAKQELAVHRFFASVEAEMQTELRRYSGKTVRGLPISKAGILAAAHRIGTTNLKIFFRTGRSKYKSRIVATMRTYSGTTMNETFLAS